MGKTFLAMLRVLCCYSETNQIFLNILLLQFSKKPTFREDIVSHQIRKVIYWTVNIIC